MSATTALLLAGAGVAYLLICVAVGCVVGRAARLGEDVPRVADLIELDFSDVCWDDWPDKRNEAA